jgi:exopolysaccharide biosynthesis polyprenyl glycosylphosphotransferase
MIWRPSYHKRIAQLADFTTAFISFALAYYISTLLHRMEPSLFPPQVEIRTSYVLIIMVLSIVYEILFDQQKAYSYQRFTSIIREYLIVIKVCFTGSLISIAVLFLFGLKDIPRTIFIVFFVVSLLLFLAEKSFLFYAASLIRRKGRNRKRIILIGTGTRARNFILTVKNNFHWGLDIVGLLTSDKERVGKEILGISIIDRFDHLEYVLKTINPEEIIITISTKRFDQIRFILDICEKEGVQVRLNSDFFGQVTKHLAVDNVFDLNIISFYKSKHTDVEFLLKRFIDIIGSLIAILIFSPLMLIAAIGILLEDGRPIFFSFVGYGLNKKPIKVVKFRTMVKNAEERKKDLADLNEMNGPVFKIKNDPRLLHFGKWLRKFSVDETPQLFSVLKGNMSLVGPRQAMKEELEEYKSWQRRRLSVKPGLACLWQIQGRNKISSFDDWTRMDLEYIDNWSLLLDIKILLKTIPSVLFGKGAS